MRKLIVTLVMVGALIVGPFALPAAAHHTHSPTTACNELLRTFWQPNHTLVWAHSHYYSSGHPAYAHCLFRNRSTFATNTRCIRYSDHNIVSVSTYCAH